MSLRDRRIQYETEGLDIRDLATTWFEQWHRWYDDAVDAGLAEPHSMTVASVDTAGDPDARVVLARAVDERGLVFYTNYESAKSHQLTAVPKAAATFAWLELHRQVRIRGRVRRLPDAESDAYFADRPRESQIGAWASPQSEVIADRAELERLVAEVARRFAGSSIPRPSYWGGWLIEPDEVEFWQGRPSRLHDRLRFSLVTGPEGHRDAWVVDRLAP